LQPTSFSRAEDESGAPDIVNHWSFIGCVDLTTQPAQLNIDKICFRSDEEMHAALDVNIPNYASAIMTTNEVVDLISSVRALGISA
jgi:hypothetical protein